MWSYEVSGIGFAFCDTSCCETLFLVSIIYLILKSYNAAVPRKICTLDILHFKQDVAQNLKSQNLSSIHILSFSTVSATRFMTLTAVAHATTAHLLLSKALGQHNRLLWWWESSHRFVRVEGDCQDISLLDLGDVMGCVSGCEICMLQLMCKREKKLLYIYIYLYLCV